MGFQGQVRLVDQQQRWALQLAVVVVDPRAQLAAQPGVEKHLFHLAAELACQCCSSSASSGISGCSHSVRGGYSAMAWLKVSSTLRSANWLMARLRV